ncbi:MAG: hypothetical protein O7G85_11150 [Planctomycetota bacterium]|nr:hypothetical protein [Planctomycetota bacterium]
MKRNNRLLQTRPPYRRSFTLVELIVAGVITTFILGSISTCLSTLAKAKISSRQRLEAYLRADSALEKMRRDVVSFIRHEDLFFSRFLLRDLDVNTPLGTMDRDEMLIFSNQLRQLRNIEYNGEGTECEVQYRVQEEFGDSPTLWRRRDAFPDKYPRGGGVATPLANSIIGLNIEVYDGFQWLEDWDSDYDGLPYAVRITVIASGESGDGEVYESSIATLRTIVAFDRILLPRQNLLAMYEAEHADDEDTENPGGLDSNGAPSLDDIILPDGSTPGFQDGMGNNIQIDSNGRPRIVPGPGQEGGPDDPRRARFLNGVDDNYRPRFIAPGSSTGSTKPPIRPGGNS